MSVVTNTVLCMSCLGDLERDTVLTEINKFFDDKSRNERGFVSVDSPDLPNGWYGGSKFLECELAIGAFNYLDLDGLIAHIKQVEYLKTRRCPTTIQLLVRHDQKSVFELIDVMNVDRARDE